MPSGRGGKRPARGRPPVPARPRSARRLTLGFLTHGIWDPVGAPLWQGAVEAARAADVDLICFVGSDLGASRLPFESQSNVVYRLASGETLDGIVVSASSLGGFIGPALMGEFLAGFPGLPIVNISGEIEGFPTVLVDNYRGMYEVTSHFIEVHARRRVAFIPGPEQSGEARERYRAFVDAVRDHGLSLEPELIAPAGEWNWLSGRRCMKAVLDRTGGDLDAVIAVCDRMAIGAMEELARRGLSVPDRVLVAGFNDSLDTLFSNPPLTTVHQPLFDIARRATSLLAAVCRGKKAPPRTLLPAMPVYRDSCGCRPRPLPPPFAAAGAGRRRGGGFRLRFRPERERLVRRLKRELRGHADVAQGTWAERLLDAFALEMDGSAAVPFQDEWTALITRFTASGGMVDILQDVLSAMEPVVTAAAGPLKKRAAKLLDWARREIGEAAKLIEVRRVWTKSQRLHLSLELVNSLNDAPDLERVLDLLSQKLPDLGIPDCVVAFYQNSDEPLAGVKPVLICRDGRREPPEDLPPGYPSLRIAPRSFLKGAERRAFLVLPLYFQERRIGFIVFRVGIENGETYENVRQALCSNLQRVRLVELRQEVRVAEAKTLAEVERLVRERTRQLETEIVERRRAQEALLQEQYLTRALTENTPDYIYFKDTQSRFIRLNEALARHLGLAAPAEGIGKNDSDFYSERFAAKTRDDEQRVMETGLPVVGIEEMEEWPDGRASWTSTTKLPLRDAEGGVVGTIGISRDITDRKRAEAEVRRLNEVLEDRVRERTGELEEANRELEAFSYSVSHDLRAPLRAMDGFAHILLDDYGSSLPSGALHHLSTIIESARQMGQLIDGLLSFSRLSRQPLTSRSVSQADLVREALARVRPEHEGRNVEFAVGELPECSGDPILLRQVWVNLISNALKFTRRREEARIEIGCKKISGRRVFFVRDNGVGFDMKFADKLFGVFQRLHRTEEYEGTGIGLATVYRIIHRHGGRIWAEAKPDEGATFYFMI